MHLPENQLPPIMEAIAAPRPPHDHTGATADNKPAPAPTAGSSKKKKVTIDKTAVDYLLISFPVELTQFTCLD